MALREPTGAAAQAARRRMATPAVVPHALSSTGPLRLAAAHVLPRVCRTRVELGGWLFSAPDESKE